MQIKVKQLEVAHDLPLPRYASAEAAGLDVVSAETLTIPAGQYRMVRTGICVAIEKGYEIQARSRSGLAVKHGLVVLHGVGTIDSDYRGEIFFPLMNHSKEDYTIKRTDRIGQLVVAKVERVGIHLMAELSTTLRGEGGFGSTGR